MKGTVYKGVRLMPGSEALRLLEAGDMRKLDAHMKMLDAKQYALEGVITSSRAVNTDKPNPKGEQA